MLRFGLQSSRAFSLYNPPIRCPKLSFTSSACRAYRTKKIPEQEGSERVPKPVKRIAGRMELPTDPKERIDLPDPQEWRAFFPPQKCRDRISISNPDTAATLAEAFVPEGSRDKVIIEAFPGELTLCICLWISFQLP